MHDIDEVITVIPMGLSGVKSEVNVLRLKELQVSLEVKLLLSEVGNGRGSRRATRRIR